MKQRLRQLLIWSQKYTKTDMLYIAKGGFWLTLGQGVRMVSGLVLVVAFANMLPKETYGTYQFVMSVATILSACTLSGMGASITRATAQGNEGALRYGFRTQLIWSIGIVLAAGAVALYYWLHENTPLAIAFLIVGACAPFLESFRLYRFYLRGKQHFRESEILGIIRLFLPLVVILTTLVYTENLVVLIAAYFLSHTLAVGLVYLQVLRTYTPPYTKDADMVNLSKHLSFLNIIGTLGKHLDKLLIFHLLGPATVAAYILAHVPLTHMRKALAILTEMAIPKLSQRQFTVLQKTLPKKVWLFLLVTIVVTILYILAAPLLFGFFFPDYPESVVLTQALALVLLSYPRSIYAQAFKAHALKREMYLTRLSIPILTIIFFSILIPVYGVWGAVYAILATHLISNVLVRYLFARARIIPTDTSV